MSAQQPRRGKKRSFDFSAVAHVGNDADEGGFLGDESAELERRAAIVLAPAGEPEPAAPSKAAQRLAGSDTVVGGSGGEVGPVDASPHLAQATTGGMLARESGTSAGTEVVHADVPVEFESQNPPQGAPSAAPAAEFEAQTSADSLAESVSGAAEPDRPDSGGEFATGGSPQSRRLINDGPGFTAASAEPPILRLKARKKRKLPPAQAQLVRSYDTQRTGRNWVVWSGRLVPDVVTRLSDRAELDGESSGRNLRPGHYFDAAIRMLPDDPGQQAQLADEWLLDRWDGEHPTGKGAQFSVSPEVHLKLSSLSKSLRSQRHGIVIDVISAAADILLDMLEDEGPLKSS